MQGKALLSLFMGNLFSIQFALSSPVQLLNNEICEIFKFLGIYADFKLIDASFLIKRYFFPHAAQKNYLND